MMSWDLIEESSKIIAINSVTYESNKEVVQYLAGLLKPLHLDIELQPGKLYDKEQFNLIAKKRGISDDNALLFNTHLDTVSPGDYSLWSKTGGNPFRATIVEDKIYGLGTADVKLDMLCKIKALEKFRDIEFKHPFILAGTYGEESGLEGAKSLIQSNKIKPRYAVVGEPSNLSIVYAHKGHLVLESKLKDMDAVVLESAEFSRIDLVGEPGHSSTPHLGVNAIVKGIDFIKQHKGDLRLVAFEGGELVNVIPDKATLWFETDKKIIPTEQGVHISMEKGKGEKTLFTVDFLNCFIEVMDLFKRLQSEFKKNPNPEFDPATSSISLGVIHTKNNEVSVKFGLRTLPSVDTHALVESLKRQLDQTLTKFPKIQGTIDVLRESLPMQTQIGSTLVTEARKVLRSLGLQDTIITKSTSTEASVYNHLGVQTIVWGPGVSVGNVHKPNEFNYIHHLNHAVRFYEKMIEDFCVKGVR